jgi:hypothetical protein
MFSIDQLGGNNLFDYYTEEDNEFDIKVCNKGQDTNLLIEKVERLQRTNNNLINEMKYLFKKIKLINVEMNKSNNEVNIKIKTLEDRIDVIEKKIENCIIIE